jgi:hypothetical protein
MREKRSVFDWLFAFCPLVHSPWVYIHNLTCWFQRLYLANFIHLNSSLISTWTLTWLGLQIWTLSSLNFFLNLVLKLNQNLWSFSWLRLLDLNQLELFIFILLDLDLNRVLYLSHTNLNKLRSWRRIQEIWGCLWACRMKEEVPLGNPFIGESRGSCYSDTRGVTALPHNRNLIPRFGRSSDF